ncbi:MAG: hypothetical protein JSS11_07505 [Verrucomicrobia bacterium]|nr:hypothetical protein [Verrucomicrobiota bacterium]
MKSFSIRFLFVFTLLASMLRAVPGTPVAAPATAYAYALKDNWALKGSLPENALIISLQGLANTDAATLYLDYPESWEFHEFSIVKGFYQTRYGMKFTQLASLDAALDALGHFAKGYVVWDQHARTSINVAFTAAGIMRGVVVDESLIPLVEKHGLKKLADFRGQFVGQSDVQIYQWAYDRYWKDCSRDMLIWMGGRFDGVMEPGIADMGIATHAFFTDLSADPRAKEEYAMHKLLLSQMKPLSYVFGWHSYKKDSEGQWVGLTSSYGLKVIGLNTFPNLTFVSQIGFTPDFKLTNNNHVTRDTKLTAKPKLYVCLVQTDSMGLGAWNEPERGEFPYNWGLGVDGMRWMPAITQMFTQDRKPNDYFIGGQSGYMYPITTPAKYFPGLMKEMREMMAAADESVVGIMDHSLHYEPVGYFDVPKRTVDLYYANVPDAIGFINGYAAAHTYDLRNGQAFMSYDYYMDEKRSEADVVADLDELIRMNPKRPYYLLIDVREWNSIKRIKSIMDALEEKPEIVPVDTFLKLAASNKTYQTRYRTSQPGDLDEHQQ